MRLKSLGYHLYLALWCVYWLQGTLFESGGLVSQAILAVLLLVSLYYFFVANYKYKLTPALKTLSLMVCLFTVYGLVSILSGETFTIAQNGINVRAYAYLKGIYISLLPIYVSFVATKQGHLTEENLRVWTFFFLGVAIIGFYQNQADSLAQAAAEGINRDGITNNASYRVLAILVFLPFFKEKPLIQYAILAISLFYVLIGMKRGAVICEVAVVLWFFFYTLFSREKHKHFFILFLFTIGIIVGLFYGIHYLLQTSDYFSLRLENTLSGDTSRRDELYRVFFSHFIYETSLLRFLVGNGANATLRIGMNYAHNDWLEIAINNGLIMVIIYMIYWRRMISTIRQSRKNDSVIYMMLSLFFIIFFLKTLFSMSYCDIPLWASTAFGYALARHSSSVTVSSH